jgi:hypothetical protein
MSCRRKDDLKMSLIHFVFIWPFWCWETCARILRLSHTCFPQRFFFHCTCQLFFFAMEFQHHFMDFLKYRRVSHITLHILPNLKKCFYKWLFVPHRTYGTNVSVLPKWTQRQRSFILISFTGFVQ